MTTIPGWLSLIGVLFTVAISLGLAGLVFRTSLLRAQITELRQTNTDLRAEILDHERREASLEQKVAVLESENTGCKGRLIILEDLVTKRSPEDAEIRQGIADLKRTVDQEVRSSLLRIEGEVRALNPATGDQDGGTAHA